MSHRNSVHVRTALFTLLALSVTIASAQKRPITAKDFDSWRTLNGQTLSPDGHYVVIQYATTFEHKKSAVETITPMQEADGSWKVSGYFIK